MPDFTIQAIDLFDFFVTPPNPSIKVSPTSGSAGATVTVQGDGFSANTTVNLHLGKFDNKTVGTTAPMCYGSTTADAAGNYLLTFTLPAI